MRKLQIDLFFLNILHILPIALHNMVGIYFGHHPALPKLTLAQEDGKRKFFKKKNLAGVLN